MTLVDQKKSAPDPGYFSRIRDAFIRQCLVLQACQALYYGRRIEQAREKNDKQTQIDHDRIEAQRDHAVTEHDESQVSNEGKLQPALAPVTVRLG